MFELQQKRLMVVFLGHFFYTWHKHLTCPEPLFFRLFDLAIVQGIRVGNFVDDPAARCYTKCIMGLMKTVRVILLNNEQDRNNFPTSVREVRLYAGAKPGGRGPGVPTPSPLTEKLHGAYGTWVFLRARESVTLRTVH